MKLNPGQMQQELKQQKFWPLYWIYGPERYLSRELVKSLRNQVVGGNSWAEERLDGAVTSASEVVAAAQSIPFGGGTRFLVVRDAHLIREPELFQELLGPRAALADLPFVCVFVAKDLDGRRKFSKVLVEQAAVVACDPIPELEREQWIHRLAVGLEIEPSGIPVEFFARSEPWSLEWVESELLKWKTAEEAEPGLGAEILVGGPAAGVSSDRFMEAFLEQRSLLGTLPWVEKLGRRPEDALPLLGLLTWNVRMLGLLAARSRSVRVAPFIEGKLRRALRSWTLEELKELQAELATLDHSIKQTPQEPLALWGVLVQRFCRK